MNGFDLSRLTETLTLLPPGSPAEVKKNPILDFIRTGRNGWERLATDETGTLEEDEALWIRKAGGERNFRCGTFYKRERSILDEANAIELNGPHSLTFEDKARMQFGSLIECQWCEEQRMEESEEREDGSHTRSGKPKKFNPNMRVLGKIKSSLWRYQFASEWNTSADVFNKIRNFRIEGFDIRLDWSTSFNEKGYAAYHRETFLDGPLAFFLYLKGEHVLTVSFAVLKNKTIGITQIQLAKKTGNRFLFKFDRKNDVITAFRKTFTGFKIRMVTGESMSKVLRKTIDLGLATREERLASAERRSTLEEREKEKNWVLENYKYFTDKDEVFDTEISPRILNFYPAPEPKRMLKAGIYEFVLLPKTNSRQKAA